MTHYSFDPEMVRVDYFKPSGKWYMTEALDMMGDDIYHDNDIYRAVETALKRSGQWRPHFTQIVLEPYHQNPYPVMFVAKEEV